MKRTVWKHQFVCLSCCQQKKVPTTEVERNVLFEAGLGRKEVEFDSLDMDSQEFRDFISESFPRLREGGGYQFCRCKPNSRELEPLSRHVMTSPRLLRERVGQGRTYIVPLQADLDLSPNLQVTDEVYVMTMLLQRQQKHLHWSLTAL